MFLPLASTSTNDKLIGIIQLLHFKLNKGFLKFLRADGLIRPSPAIAPLAKTLSPSASVPAFAAPLCVTLPLEPLVAVGGSTG